MLFDGIADLRFEDSLLVSPYLLADGDLQLVG